MEFNIGPNKRIILKYGRICYDIMSYYKVPSMLHTEVIQARQNMVWSSTVSYEL